MIDLGKRTVLQGLNRLGYRVLKKQEHERLLAAEAQAQPATIPLSSPVVVQPSPPAPSPQITTYASVTEGAGLAKLLESLKDICDLPLPRILALYSIGDYLIRARVEGEVVDCCYGKTAGLVVVATAFAQIGDTSRRLALFDTTADPLHRPEIEFELWGTDRDPLSSTTSRRRSQKPELPPKELAATGYPVDKFSIRRYPREPITQTEPVAFLGLTSASYPSNRTTIATFLPRVISGGVIAVEPDPLERGGRDAVQEFLRKQGVNMLFLHVAPDYRVGIRP
jgi:O-methyltransferase